MPYYIDVIEVCNLNKRGTINPHRSYTLYRRENGVYTKRTKAETRRNNQEQEQIIGMMLAAASKMSK